MFELSLNPGFLHKKIRKTVRSVERIKKYGINKNTRISIEIVRNSRNQLDFGKNARNSIENVRNVIEIGKPESKNFLIKTIL